MDDFDRSEEYAQRLAAAYENSQGYRKLAVDSLFRGDYTIAKFQMTQELKWYCAFASLRDALQTGSILAPEEYLDEFMDFVFGDWESPYLKYREKVCELMSWDAKKEHMDERIVSRFVNSCMNEMKKDSVLVLKEGER